jgi:hypothetical protein
MGVTFGGIPCLLLARWKMNAGSSSETLPVSSDLHSSPLEESNFNVNASLRGRVGGCVIVRWILGWNGVE